MADEAEDIHQVIFIVFFIFFILCVFHVFCSKIQKIRDYNLDQRNHVVEVPNSIEVPPKYQELDSPPPY